MPPLSSTSSSARDTIIKDPFLYEQNQLEGSSSEESEPFIRRHRRTQFVLSAAKEGSEQHIIASDNSIVDSDDDFRARTQDRKHLDSIRRSDFAYPASSYEGFKPPTKPSSESDAIKDLTGQMQQQKSLKRTMSDVKNFVEFDLSDFSIYLPETVAHYPGAMTGLQNLATKPANFWYCFDGVLSLGESKHYLYRVLFQLCSIGNYGLESDSVDGEIWVQSQRNQHSDIYYRLKSPSDEYSRYFDGFTWLADLAKHFVDYLEAFSGRGLSVSIHNFKSDFVCWLEKLHGASPIYRAWFTKFNKTDFRCHVAANVEFLWKETNGISTKLLTHPIWKEVKSMNFIPKQKMKAKNTIVTPYVYDCFSHLKFGDQLSKIAPSSGIEHRRKSLGRTLQLTTNISAATIPVKLAPQPPAERNSIAIGDVLGVPMDDKGSSLWKDEKSKWKAADECWYVLVQDIHIDKHGKKSFDVIWLYKPSDTTCAKMKYPFANELFLSDNCSCDTTRITEDEVLCKVSVKWNGLPGDSEADFFIRQTYLRSNAFVTLKKAHKRCVHLRDEIKTPLQDLVDKFKVGDTILYVPPSHLSSKHSLEPGEIVEFLQQGAKGFVTVRRLLRRNYQDDKSMMRPNELIYSDETCTVPADKIKQRCFVRFYSSLDVENKKVPPPYNRNGTGLAFYVTTRLIGEKQIPVYPQLPPSLIQGPDFISTSPRQRLRGLDLYCGGGNFGRGLEEGGSIRNTHAVDLDGNAIHTYWANIENKDTKLFYGSVNDMLMEALKGNPSKSKLIPLPGDIDFISAGSPCPGFSVLNSRKDNAQGLKNQSLVASVAAYIDVYRPKYALLENVVTMAQKKKNRDEDVLSQLICCVVGMGYQVQVFNLDVWSFGSSQSRSRLFVSIAAPELEPPPHPYLSHSHPDGTKDRGLGLMASGHPFGERHFQPTPFDYVTALEATVDLPDIGDGRTYHCTQHPDHRMTRGIPQKLKAQIEIIPINPRGMGFAKTLKHGLMTRAERSLFPTLTRKGRPCHSVEPTSQAWQRIHPQKLFPTIATSASPGCARTGRCLHWDQQRLITVLEARRAQGFPDHEVLTGVPSRQWRIVGNSVARTVSLALGMSIGEACRKNLATGQNLEISQDIPDTYAVELDSCKAPPVSALEKMYPSSTDSGTRSTITYNRSLNASGMKSSINSAAVSSTPYSTDSSKDFVTKRTHNLPSQVAIPHLEKRKFLHSVVPRDNAKKGCGVKCTSEEEPEGEDPKPDVMKLTYQGHKKLKRSNGEKIEKLKRKRVSDSTIETVSSESEDMRCIVSSRKISVGQQRRRYTEISETTTSSVSVSSKVYKLPHGDRQDREVNVQRRQKTECEPSKPSFESSPSRAQSSSSAVISLLSEDEYSECNVSTNRKSTNDDEDLMFVSSKKKHVQPYVPVDNSMFIAYERTHQAMNLGAKKGHNGI